MEINKVKLKNELVDFKLAVAELLVKDNKVCQNEAHNVICAAILDKYNFYQNDLFNVKSTSVWNFVKDNVDEFTQGYSVSEVAIELEKLHIHFYNYQIVRNKNGNLTYKKDKSNGKYTGAVYTNTEIVNDITKKTISNWVKKGNDINSIKLLDFACGTGRFICSAIDILVKKYGLNINDVLKNNVFAVDIDQLALVLLAFKIKSCYQIEGLDWSEFLVCKNALKKSTGLFDDDHSFNLESSFKRNENLKGFDVVISNPPYLVLKINDKGGNPNISEIKSKVEGEVKYFKTSGIYNHSLEGMLNYYKISIERIINLTNDQGEVGIICPSTLFGDVSSKKLRKHLLSDNNLREIRFYAEKANLFENVTQATSIFYLEKKGVTQEIQITSSNDSFKVKRESILKNFPKTMEIPQMDEYGWRILDKLSALPKLKSLSMFRNKRGELDLTQAKKYITEVDNGWNLIRGNAISGQGINYTKVKEFVLQEQFVESKSESYKALDFNKKRIICQQISNMDSLWRVQFVDCNENDILGNSCNYISCKDHGELQRLKFILNSALVNWRFKVTSTNNHINNYELDELPIIPLHLLDNELIDPRNLEQNERLNELCGLSKAESTYILKQFFDVKE